MNGKENIINKILSDADQTCAKIVADAEQTARETVSAAQNAVERDRLALQQRLDLAKEERLRNACANARLEAKKYALFTKQQLVARCYQEVRSRIANFDQDKRLAFVGGLIEKYAEEGETVYFTERDGKFVTPMWLNGFEKHLKLGNRYIHADGGIVLEGEGYEKDLTLQRVVELVKDQTEAQTANILGVHNE